MYFVIAKFQSNCENEFAGVFCLLLVSIIAGCEVLSKHAKKVCGTPLLLISLVPAVELGNFRFRFLDNV